MDAKDLLKQLTCGAKFIKSNRDLKFLNLDNRVKVANAEETVENVKSEGTLNKNFKGEMGSQTFELISGAPNSFNKKVFSADELDRRREDIQSFRRENRITVLGKLLPAPITTFEELRTCYNMDDKLVRNLLSCNYTKPTAIQMQAIPIILKGRHLMASAPTGSGKTIAYLAPVIHHLKVPKKIGFRALILAPTRELAQQIYRECVRLSDKTALKIHIISKVGQSKIKYAETSSNKFDILISTPNRIRFLLQQEPPILDLKSIEWFILDEADRLMEEGQNNFKEQLDVILSACSNRHKKIALFSATYTVPVAKWALKNLKNLVRVNIGAQNAATEFVEQELLFVGSESGKLLALRDMVRNGMKPPVLIFVQSRDRAKQLFEELLYDGINVDVIHADRTQQQRDNCVRAFREGNIWILICTELMGRGIDFKGINLVINYDFPSTTISYIHRIGRTGRAGRLGKAVTFFTQDDTPHLKSIAEIVRNCGGNVPGFMLNMDRVKKSEKKKLAKFARKREDISTEIKPEPKRMKQIEESENRMKKEHLSNSKTN